MSEVWVEVRRSFSLVEYRVLWFGMGCKMGYYGNLMKIEIRIE